LDLKEFLRIYQEDHRSFEIIDALDSGELSRIHIQGIIGSAKPVVGAAIFKRSPYNHFFVLPDKESAAYFYNDLENLFEEQSVNYNKKKVLFFPTSYKKHHQIGQTDNTNLLSRSEVLNRFATERRSSLVVTYPEALCEKVITRDFLNDNLFRLKTGDMVSLDFLGDLLLEYDFERVEFVVEPGQFSIRGGIVDVFSFSNDFPFRIEFFGDEVESIRTFNPANQLSINKLVRITLLPNIQDRESEKKRVPLLSFIEKNTVLWFDDIQFMLDRIEKEFGNAQKVLHDDQDSEIQNTHDLFLTEDQILSDLQHFRIIEFGKKSFFRDSRVIGYHMEPQPSFNKNFDLLIHNLNENQKGKYQNLITTDNPQQLERIYTIVEDVTHDMPDLKDTAFTALNISFHEGFIDHDLKMVCYTDHQIFDRYHRFRLKESYKGKESLSIKELYDLSKGDYVTHIDHGIGVFDGLEKIENNGKQQEAIRLVYSNNDLLYISIHSLHRISKYVGKDGASPKLNRLGSNAWNKLKEKTKKRVKDIAKDLIALYAKRKSTKGFSFSPDSYLQHELEASFIYEDTPDQLKSTVDVKTDMEATNPMDRLVCGDVGFGKTEVAIRAAFKAVTDSKQVAVLVPTTILALQHYHTFSERLKEFPCKVDYINRFKSTKEQKQTLKDLEEDRLDILIGTHRLISKDVKFKNLGLFIVDEEQKFGVAAKERLKQMKVNVDTLTLTATPIPRTLQFSLMGARDLSIINTPPPNRFPIQTEIHPFNETIIRDAIIYELSRGGQVYFVNNRVQNIIEVTTMIEKIVPGTRIAVGHGQMDGKHLEKTMLDFIEGRYDVLVATTIIESGLDIPNVNTIIINEAQNYGLSDLHQLRGRVGRSNKKAFCFLLAPPPSVLTPVARKRLKAIEEFSDLGSGFNIAMRDLDIRGAGNILGGEQSGFISEIGFEMYHKILDEAVQELKDTEFKNLYKTDVPQKYVKDCQIETDLELLIPDDYITNITERMSLYKELDNIETEEDLMRFSDRLIDRFGPIPTQVDGLINTIRMRWIAKELGFEKILLKQGRFTGYFVTNQESPYYRSDLFSSILVFVQQNPQKCRMKEKKDKLTLSIAGVNTVQKALDVLRNIQGIT